MRNCFANTCGTQRKFPMHLLHKFDKCACVSVHATIYSTLSCCVNIFDVHSDKQHLHNRRSHLFLSCKPLCPKRRLWRWDAGCRSKYLRNEYRRMTKVISCFLEWCQCLPQLLVNINIPGLNHPKTHLNKLKAQLNAK